MPKRTWIGLVEEPIIYDKTIGPSYKEFL